MRRSLSLHLVLFAAFWIALALVGTGFVITYHYRVHIENHFDAHVHRHLEELVATIEPDGAGGARLSREPTDPQFLVDGSGWYWAAFRNGQRLVASPSLGDRQLDLTGIRFIEGAHTGVLVGPEDQLLRAHVTRVAIPGELGLLTLFVSAPAMTITDDVSDFRGHITSSLLVLGIGILAALLFQVVVVMRPLRAMRQAIAEIRAGARERLPTGLPSDLQPLVTELNHVLDHNETLLRRARNHMADLAHALKNPLTVVRNAARRMPGEEAKLVLDQSHLMAASTDHALARARMYANRDGLAQRTAVRPVLDDVRFAVEHLHRDRDLQIVLEGCSQAHFRGEPQDLEEMVGNLVDNACKWAEATVRLSCRCDSKRLRLQIDDDGPGIDETDRKKVQERGVRRDEATPGHGHGLAIVRELAELYGGELTLTTAPLGGLRAELTLPAA